MVEAGTSQASSSVGAQGCDYTADALRQARERLGTSQCMSGHDCVARVRSPWPSGRLGRLRGLADNQFGRKPPMRKRATRLPEPM
jgi:hypothetical protein